MYKSARGKDLTPYNCYSNALNPKAIQVCSCHSAKAQQAGEFLQADNQPLHFEKESPQDNDGAV
jgi:hypothetical protein